MIKDVNLLSTCKSFDNFKNVLINSFFKCFRYVPYPSSTIPVVADPQNVNAHSEDDKLPKSETDLNEFSQNKPSTTVYKAPAPKETRNSALDNTSEKIGASKNKNLQNSTDSATYNENNSSTIFQSKELFGNEISTYKVNATVKSVMSQNKKPHIKKPLNAFMLYMKEMRAKVVAECTLKESAAINQILGRRVKIGG